MTFTQLSIDNTAGQDRMVFQTKTLQDEITKVGLIQLKLVQRVRLKEDSHLYHKTFVNTLRGRDINNSDQAILARVYPDNPGKWPQRGYCSIFTDDNITDRDVLCRMMPFRVPRG